MIIAAVAAAAVVPLVAVGLFGGTDGRVVFVSSSLLSASISDFTKF